jgi:predicted metallo-beta-lactamase superfamily hydrolase
MPHGEPQSRLSKVMMTRIEDDETVFVHASDIQLLNEEAVSLILEWQPDIVLVSGPPLYLSSFMNKHRRQKTWKQAVRLANGVEMLIIDHHLLRCEEGLSWLDCLSSEVNHRVVCAADFMGQSCHLLEARRQKLYAEIPVSEDWHEAYACGDADTQQYRNYTDG